MLIPAGTRLSHFEIRSNLDTGGLGEVYRALDTRLGREVVVKILPTEATGKHLDIRAFEREARLASWLDHPNICRTLEISRVEDFHLIAMQYVEGLNVQQLTAGGHPLELRRTLSIASQVTDALAAAHKRGLVHGDIRDTNVMVTDYGLVKVLGFGLSRVLEQEEGHAPHVTTPYVAPEQLRGGEVSSRSDIFSTGVLLYEMVTGRMPSPEDTRSGVLQRADRLTPRLSEIVKRATAPDPSARYPRMEEFHVDIRDALRETESGSGIGPIRPPDNLTPDEYKLVVIPPSDLLSKYRLRPWMEKMKFMHQWPNLRGGLESQAQAPSGRHVNAWLMEESLPLYVGKAYQIGVNIGALRADIIGGGEFDEPEWGDRTELELLIALNSVDAEVSPDWIVVKLPKHGDTEAVYFTVTPLTDDVVNLHLSIYLARDLTLLEKFRMSLPVVKAVAATVQQS